MNFLKNKAPLLAKVERLFSYQITVKNKRIIKTGMRSVNINKENLVAQKRGIFLLRFFSALFPQKKLRKIRRKVCR